MPNSKRLLAITGATMGSMAMGFSFSLISINLESIYQYFGATLVELQWMINIYGIFIASLLVSMGRLGDIYGRKRLFLIGNILFGIAMLGAGCSASSGMIIVFQTLYGISAAILLPLSQALIVGEFPDNKKSLAIGIWLASNAMCFSLGPIIGGLLLNFLSWRWIFLINIPFAILGFILTLMFTNETKTEGESTKIDWLGVIFLTFTIGFFVLATAQWNLWSKEVICLLYIASIIFLALLIIIEKKVEMPIIREELFQSRTFLFSCIGGFCMIGILWAGIFLIPLYVQKVLGYKPIDAGLLMLAYSLPVALLSPLIGQLYTKLGSRMLIGAGFSLLALSAFMHMQYSEITSTSFIVVAVLILGLGFSLIWTPTTTGALSAISRNFAGIASGTFITIQEIGGNMGLAISATAARLNPNFSSGFKNGIWVLFAFSILGIASAIFLPKKPKKLTKL